MADEDALAVLYRLRPEIAVIASGLHANAFSLQDVAIDDELPGLQAGGGRGYGAYGSTAGGGAPEELAGAAPFAGRPYFSRTGGGYAPLADKYLHRGGYGPSYDGPRDRKGGGGGGGGGGREGGEEGEEGRRGSSPGSPESPGSRRGLPGRRRGGSAAGGAGPDPRQVPPGKRPRPQQGPRRILKSILDKQETAKGKISGFWLANTVEKWKVALVRVIFSAWRNWVARRDGLFEKTLAVVRGQRRLELRTMRSWQRWVVWSKKSQVREEWKDLSREVKRQRGLLRKEGDAATQVNSALTSRTRDLEGSLTVIRGELELAELKYNKHMLLCDGMNRGTYRGGGHGGDGDGGGEAGEEGTGGKGGSVAAPRIRQRAMMDVAMVGDT